jgi:aspartate aminotransferase-like enzyme
MGALLDNIDPNGLEEFSVVFTDRSLNHMSSSFQQVMNDISGMLKEVYSSDAVVIVPGGGTFGMEAVARQFGRDAKVLVSKIRSYSPDIVFAPHVETSAGIILPDSYIKKMAEAAHEVGAIMVLDCIASGCAWIDMNELGVDVLISAPQKGWSASPSAGLVMLSTLAIERMETSTSDSFAIDLKKWHSIMQAYESGGHAYHTTMPTDALRAFRDTMQETKEYGFDRLYDAQWDLGNKVRGMLKDKGVNSVAPEGFGAPGVVVSYTQDPSIQNGSKFTNLGMQIAAGVPLACDEPQNFMTFRLGLFGLDKLYDVSGTVDRLRRVIDQVL